MENIFEGIIKKNFPSPVRDPDSQIQEVQRKPGKFITKGSSPRHIVIRLSKLKIKERILIAMRKKHQANYKGKPRPSTMIQACNPSTLGGQGRQIMRSGD